MIETRLEEEASFLHGELDDAMARRYAAFMSDPPLTVTGGEGSNLPARLVTERYANVYFGIVQSVEIDSLRAAIESTYPTTGTVRDLCLCALLLACITCATGPHFAQPAQVNSMHSLRVIVERRARSVVWEFDLALGRLAARRPPRLPFADATRLNWREALTRFGDRVEGTVAGVYIDPPYSKLQYSRYYHVLNVLLAYDYPPVSGAGRYPPRDRRLSSRFEYQPGAAQRELADTLRLCAERRLTPILSCAEVGFARIGTLAETMAKLFGRVEFFSEELRHHSQGRPLKVTRATVVEHVLVGHPG
jgi:adenine-specific DNA-methyltransferase